MDAYIFYKILNNSKDASVVIWDIISQFENDVEKAESWIQLHSKTFRVSTTKDGTKLIHLCLENVMPCFDYWSENGCQNEECEMFHICKKYLFEVKHPERISCKYNHDIYHLSRSELAANHNLKFISPEHLLVLLKTRFPTVCEEYLQGQCQLADLCRNIHICGEFIEGRCKKPDGLCSHAHESGLTTYHTENIMHDFHIREGNYQNCIIYDGSPISHSVMTAKKELEAGFDSFRDEAICHRNLIDSCIKGSLCNLTHTDPKSPYLWQYRIGNAWENFDHNISMSIEAFYSQPENESFDNPCVSRLVVNFPQQHQIWKGKYGDDEIEVRRLSTKSSVNAAERENVSGLTEWKWYWDSVKFWEEYSGLVCSEDIEKSFLDKTKSKHMFQTKLYKYSLNFKEMEQQNLGPSFFTKRRVRRRPVFKDIDDIIKPVCQLPSHWPKNFQDGDCISVADKFDEEIIKTEFMNGIGKKVNILSVEEVCNSVFYKKYFQTRQILIEKLDEDNINEMMLYHGTSSDVVPNICVQNFDWRLNRNVTSYGQ